MTQGGVRCRDPAGWCCRTHPITSFTAAVIAVSFFVVPADYRYYLNTPREWKTQLGDIISRRGVNRGAARVSARRYTCQPRARSKRSVIQ